MYYLINIHNEVSYPNCDRYFKFQLKTKSNKNRKSNNFIKSQACLPQSGPFSFACPSALQQFRVLNHQKNEYQINSLNL